LKPEIINNFFGVCRGFLGFEKEKSFDGNGAEEVLSFSTIRAGENPKSLTTKDTKVHEGNREQLRLSGDS
jgi:hypothetical protein